MEEIYSHLKSIGKNASKSNIKQILSSLPVYSKYKEPHSSKFHNPFYIYFLHQQWQSDICYFPELSQYNNGVKYLLVVIEVFSRKIFVSPMKSKTKEATLKSFRSIHKYIDFSPKTLSVDKGKEFRAQIFQNYCLQNNIKLIFSNSSTKASIVERCQRNLQSIIYKYMAQFKTKNYVKNCPKL